MSLLNTRSGTALGQAALVSKGWKLALFDFGLELRERHHFPSEFVLYTFGRLSAQSCWPNHDFNYLRTKAC